MKYFLQVILFFSLITSSCQKEYACVCMHEITGEKIYKEKVKTTNLGKKGFEKSCQSKNDTINKLRDCHIE